MYDSEKSTHGRHGLCEVYQRNGKKKFMDEPDEKSVRNKEQKDHRSCTQQNQLLLVVAFIVCFITVFRMFATTRPVTERRAIICTNLEDCDIDGKKIIFGGPQEIRNIRVRKDEEELKVESPGTITKKMTTEEWNSIYKRTVLRERYIIDEKNRRQKYEKNKRQKPSENRINDKTNTEQIIEQIRIIDHPSTEVKNNFENNKNYHITKFVR
jgi:hypothetical protein